jgi:hypothetical protein
MIPGSPGLLVLNFSSESDGALCWQKNISLMDIGGEVPLPDERSDVR